MDQHLAILAEAIRDAGVARRALRFRGGGTKDFYGHALQGEILDTRAYRGIVDYDPTELVITARAGTPLAEIEATLAEHGQMLAFEPPHFGQGATLGGCIAAGLSGPRRQAAGALRDFVLGASLMSHQGEVLTFGGRVMKNVAGYDVSRLLVGSLGSLGLIVDVSLKVLPRPAAETTLVLEMDDVTALRKLNEWAGKAVPISASVWRGGILSLRLSGTSISIDTAMKRVMQEFPATSIETRQSTIFWTNVREQSDPFFSADTPLWRLSVPSTTPPLKLGKDTLIEWGGALRWLHGDIDANVVRAEAERAGGHATRFRGAKEPLIYYPSPSGRGDGVRKDAEEIRKAAPHPDPLPEGEGINQRFPNSSISTFHPLPAALRKIHLALKAEFDPAGIFNPRRMYDDL